MGKNMLQLQKNQLVHLCSAMVLFIILGIFFFSGCAAKKNPNMSTTDVKQQQESKTTAPSAEVATKTASTQKIVQSVKLLEKADAVEVIIQGNKELKYTSIKQSFPFGIAIYLPDTRLYEKITSIVPEAGDISNIISSYADKDKKTAKIEILLNRDLPYDIEKQSDSLRIIIASENKIVKPQANTVKQDTKTASKKTVKIPKGIANVSEIEFNVEDAGYTELKLTTTHPVKFDFSRGKNGILNLNLYKTNIPNRHKRPFETKYFKSAVYKILPIQKFKNSKNSKIEISMREKVPYHVVQSDNMITVRFEPSSIEPPKFTKADKTLQNTTTRGTNALANMGSLSQDFQNPEVKQSKSGNNSVATMGSKSLGRDQQDFFNNSNSTASAQLSSEELEYKKNFGEKKYTGEKIKLDFYQTDIKNVFRILSSISNKNFAIDKNVNGNVTLTLDNPIPWDQVLDLILDMNQLGRIETGGVIRIATQDTIANEAKQRQARFQAIQKAKNAKKALQPVITEYIPINYADAGKDIQPHLIKILTPKRGSVSVDRRTNTIIITDTRETLIRAKELIYTLDNVTPQIMIRAKIIEANKDFSRSLGIGAKFGFDEDVTKHGNDKHEVSLNSPKGVANAISFTFNNLVPGAFGDGGTSFLTTTLNAAESKGDIEVLSSPKILTLDNVKATIRQGIEYPYNKLDKSGNTTIEFKNVDLLLEVTPHVTPDKRISMEILVTKNEIAGFTNLVPSLSVNEARTTLLVNNNDTIVIGGVIKTKTTHSKSGFPFLMNIPILGRLMRTDLNKTDKQELLIFITPTIVQLEQRKDTGS